jgi:tRNASer (uridine44-2'-O)-methyltransferase
MPGRRKGLDEPLLPLTVSLLRTTGTSWLTSLSYHQSSLPISATAFHSVNDALLENPNLNSSHLFRADIIFDSTGILKTNKEKEDFCCVLPSDQQLRCEIDGLGIDNDEEARPALNFTGFELRRTVLRKLIPRKPQLDRSLLQTCHIYSSIEGSLICPDENVSSDNCANHGSNRLSLEEKLHNKSRYKQSITQNPEHLVVYQPHADPLTGSDMPWYHPPLKFLAYLYSRGPPPELKQEREQGISLSVHFQPFQGISPADGPSSITNREHRTLLSLLSTLTRLARNTPVCVNPIDGEEEAKPISATQHIKDNIVPEHLVQNTYTRLKTLYASDLMARWVEKTDPSKHVFEDLSIAAFLIELWKKMYGSRPSDFPGFVDIACGNGVLVYILIMEGFRGFGFDARVRRTWSIFPAVVTAHLKETVCVPRPFLETLQSQEYSLQEDLVIHDGIFEAGTFIISNHADELTTWTPLLAALSSPESPLPWLAIPCCSHALSGAAHRYQPFSHPSDSARARRDLECVHSGNSPDFVYNEQPQAGDLKALRGSQDHAREYLMQGHSSRKNSTYGCLVNQVTRLANKVDSLEDVQQTLMRIPSTRNIGIVGGQLRGVQSKEPGEAKGIRDLSPSQKLESADRPDLIRQIHDAIEEECVISGGLAEAAKMWMVSVRKARGVTRHTFESGPG